MINKNILMSYMMCLHIEPFFRLFSERFLFASPNLVAGSLSIFQAELVNNKNMGEDLIQSNISLLESFVPDMDDFDSALLPSLALDAIAATLTLYDLIQNFIPSKLNDVFEIYKNTSEFIDAELIEFSSFGRMPADCFSARQLGKDFVCELNKGLPTNTELTESSFSMGRLIVDKYSYIIL